MINCGRVSCIIQTDLHFIHLLILNGSCIVKLLHWRFQAVPVLTHGFMNKEKLIGCICHCTVAFIFSPQAAFRVLGFMRLTGRTVGKLERARGRGRREKTKSVSLSYAIIKFDPSLGTVLLLQKRHVGGPVRGAGRGAHGIAFPNERGMLKTPPAAYCFFILFASV